ncbi:hypothetical protein Cgig2_032758 [Carnegiea gigantea]|uniref:Protein kinase domain-containing protein n=1 Tax=Carnegiea gigantea TaxID=171969 RepID=A0A9Q1KJD9_9CARY|nr:hypothetical protein Cgig2_032758 [Carnegiea gigantea]
MYDFGSSIWIMLVLIIALFQLNFFFSSSLNDEGVALLKFREKVVNDPFGALSRWNEDDRENKPCSWFGIECFDGYVVSLQCENINAELLRSSMLLITLVLFPIHPGIVVIRSILRNNSFSGAIPEEIRDLKELKLLDLGYNSFTRALPSDFEHNITILLLDNNGQNSDTSPEVEKHIMLSEAEMDDNHLICAMQSLPYTRLARIEMSVMYCNVSSVKLLTHNKLLSTSGRHNGWGRNAVPLRMLTEKAREGAAETPPTKSSSSPAMTSGKGRELQNVGALSSSSAQNFLDHFPFRKPSPPPLPELLPFDVPLPPTLTTPPPLAPPPPPVPSSTSVPTAPPPPPPPRAKSVHSKPLVPALGAVGGFIVLAVIVGAIYLWRSNMITKIRGFNGHLQGTFATGALNLKKSELETACEDFSNVIGSSSIGTIYKGTLSSGIEIAVISLPVTSAKEWSHHLQMQFRKKIETLSKVNHKNFVKLMGYCEEEHSFTRMMVFEYAPNGTLFEHLHVREAEHLDWGMRLRVTMGIAYCLEHMHQLVPPIAHPNFNSSAVSLAEDYAAKISDFSLWNQVVAAQVQPTVTAILSPSSATPDSNVYSFGLVLMEMMTGRVPVSSENNGLLEDWAYDYLRGDRPLQVWVDPMLRYFNPGQLEKIGEVIRKCLELNPQLRPTMKDVAAKLRETTGIDRDKAVPRLTPLWWEEVEVLSVA